MAFRCRRSRLLVKLADADDSFRTGKQPANITPDFRTAIGKVSHGASVPLVDPGPITFKIVRRLRRGDPSEVESALLCEAFYGIRSQILGYRAGGSGFVTVADRSAGGHR